MGGASTGIGAYQSRGVKDFLPVHVTSRDDRVTSGSLRLYTLLRRAL